MTHIFEQLLTMALTALPVMAVVLAARWLLRGAPKKYTYLLWLVVAFRLLCPVAPECPVGLLQPEETAQQISEAADSYIEPTLTYRDNGGFTPDYDVLLNRGYTPNERGEIITNEAGTREALQGKDVYTAAAALWLLGMAAMVLYLVFSTLRLKQQVATAVRREDNIWECDGIPTPFVLGLFRPRIYIPFRMTEAERAYILAHERYHIRCGDHWVKLLGLVILTVYWWNPAVWLCWVLFCRDMEMRCDEAVLARLGDGVKQDYSRSLISFALDRRAPMALAFGEHDAAKRVKHVLQWKKAAPAVVFLAVAAVVIVALVCGTNAESGKHNQVTLRTSPDGGMEFDVEATEDIHSWCLYRDIYHNGALISSGETVLDGFADENAGVSTRDFTGRLYVEAEHDAEGGFTNRLTWNLTTFGMAGFTETLPEPHYTGAAHIIGEGEEKTTYRTEADEDILLYTVLLSTEPEGKTTLFAADRPLTQVNNTVVQYRLLLSSGTMAELPVPQLDLAQSLFDLRLLSLRDPADAEPLLEKLGVAKQGSYTLDRGTDSNGTRYLLIAFDSSPADEETLQKEMWGVSCLLTALIGDIDGVNYSYPLRADQASSLLGSTNDTNATQSIDTEDHFRLITVYGDHGGDSYAETLGYESLHDLGQSAAGIRALMQYLGMDTGSEDAASSLAKALYAARNEPEKLLSLLDPAGELGGVEFSVSASNYLTMLFHDSTLDPALRDTAAWKYSMVMLALLDGYVATSWNWMDDGVQAYEGNSGLWNTAEWLTEHGLEKDVRAYGVSPAMVQTLLNALNLQSSDTTRSLFAAMQSLDDMALMQKLLGAELWDSPITQPATVGWPGNFGPSVRFYATPEDADALDVAMARRAALLMKLRPTVGYVLWSYPDETGQTVHRDLQSSEAQMLASLSSHTQTSLPVETAEDLDLYIRFLQLDEKLFLSLSKEGSRFSPDRIAEETAVWFAPEDIHDIEYAALEWWDGQRFYPLTGEGYDYIEERLGSASQIGATGCPFKSAVLYLHRADGVVGKVIPAGDSCDIFQSDGKYYQFGDRAQAPYYDDNSTLFAHFGTSVEELPHYTVSGVSSTAEPAVFANVLLKREEVGTLLDGRHPSDLYFDLDSWEDGSINELGCFVYYYDLTRAEFRQLLEQLDTTPEYLQVTAPEGSEHDLAHVTVSGTWTRAEIEQLAAAMGSTLPEIKTNIPQETPSPAEPEEETPSAPSASAGYRLPVSFRAESTTAAKAEVERLMAHWPLKNGGSNLLGYSFTHYKNDENLYAGFGITPDGAVYALPYPAVPLEKVERTFDTNAMTYILTVRIGENTPPAEGMALPPAAGTYTYTISLPDFTCVESFVPLAGADTRIPFGDILGFVGYAVTEPGAGPSHNTRTYYTVRGGGPMKIAETFGFGEPQDYSVDLDGDGVKELVSNVQYGADGAQRVYVYQRRGNDVYLGTLSPDGLPDFDNWGANAYWSEYDPAERVFRFHYAQKNSEAYGVWETSDLTQLHFNKFTP